jgi:hypothetical protein
MACCDFVMDPTKEQRVCRNATFLSRVITGGESWIYSYDPEIKQQSFQWKSPNSLRPKKGKTGEEQSQEHDHHFL